MTESIANVATTDTFATWLTRTNLALTALRNSVPSTGGVLTGNVTVNGTFTTQELVVNDNINANTAIYVGGQSVWHAGNDGSLSGLDSDLLDGQHGAYYLGAGNLTGTVPNARISGAYSGFTNITASGNGSFTGTVSAARYTGNGANITSVDADTVGGLGPTAFLANTFHDDFANLTGVANVATYQSGGYLQKDFKYSPAIALVDGGTITPDANAFGNIYTVTLGGNRTLANPSNLTSAIGKEIILEIKQDGTGSRTLTWGSAWKFPLGAAPTLTTTAAALDVVVGVVRSATEIHCGYAATDVK